MLSDKIDTIQRWEEQLQGSLKVGLLQTPDKRSDDFKSFMDELLGLTSKLELTVEQGEKEDIPAILLSDLWRYHMIPGGTELKPFLDHLSNLDRGETNITGECRSKIERVRFPARIKIYVTTQCPICPDVVSQLCPLPLINPKIHLTMIDGLFFPELAKADRVQAVPTVFCDDQFRWTGPFHWEEFLDVLIQRDPSRLGADVYKRMIKEGDSSGLADMMIHEDHIFPAFLDVLTHREWPVRLGAMVVAEEIFERKPALAKQILESLYRKMGQLNDSVKGDMVYLFGESADKAWIPMLKNLFNSTSSTEIHDAIEEAIEKLAG